MGASSTTPPPSSPKPQWRWPTRKQLLVGAAVLPFCLLALVVLFLSMIPSCHQKEAIRAPQGDPKSPPTDSQQSGSISISDTTRHHAKRKKQGHAYDASGSYYNALFSSTVAGSNNTLLDMKPIHVNFDIGPRKQLSSVPLAMAGTNPNLARNLLVTFSCLFCASEQMQKRFVTYDPISKRSLGSVEFELTPSLKLLRARATQGSLIFQVTGGDDGVLYDNVLVPVSILAAGEAAVPTLPKIARAASELLTRAEDTTVTGDDHPDLTISCYVTPSAQAESSGHVMLKFQANNPDLIRDFDGRDKNPDGTPKAFDTKLPADVLSRLTAHDYDDLVSVVTNNTALQEALTGDPNNTTSLTSDKLSLREQDKQALMDKFHFIGSDLYRLLFLVNEDSAPLARALDGYDNGRLGRSLRIRIESQIFIPWTLLHPLEGDLAADRFWGFRYALAVDPSNEHDHRYAGRSTFGSGPVLLLKYHASDSDDAKDKAVAQFGDLHYEFLKSELNNVHKVETRQVFHDEVKGHWGDMQMIVAYTHADNGTVFARDPGTGDIIRNLSESGAKLRFSKTEFLSVLNLFQLPTELQMTSLELKQHPLVFLNGCETSGAGYFSTPTWSFPGEFLRIGARGVVATEAPIWDVFGYDFGQDIIKKLKSSGSSVPLVLLDTRRQWMHDNNNPLGLLYSYYGGLDASFDFN